MVSFVNDLALTEVFAESPRRLLSRKEHSQEQAGVTSADVKGPLLAKADIGRTQDKIRSRG
jgi:hypothetical protein